MQHPSFSQFSNYVFMMVMHFSQKLLIQVKCSNPTDIFVSTVWLWYVDIYACAFYYSSCVERERRAIKQGRCLLICIILDKAGYWLIFEFLSVTGKITSAAVVFPYRSYYRDLLVEVLTLLQSSIFCDFFINSISICTQM